MAAGCGARGAGRRTCVLARAPVCVRARVCARVCGAWAPERVCVWGGCVLCVCVCVCVCARVRAGWRGRVCACLSSGPLGALGNRLQDKCCPAAPRRAHSLAPTRAPGLVAPGPAAPRRRTPPPKGDQVICFRECHGDPNPLPLSHNKSHVFCRLGRKDWSGEGRLISAA